MTFGPAGLLAAIGAVLFLAMAFLTARHGGLRQRLFAAFLSAASLSLVNFVIVDSGLAMMQPRLIFIGNTLGLAAAPLLYLFAHAMASEGFRLSPQHVRHFVPLAVISAIVIWQYHARPEADQIAILTGAASGSWLNSPVFVLAIFAYPLAYLTATALLVRRYEQASRATRSSSDGREMRWLLVSIAGLAAGAGLSIAHYVFTNLYPVAWLALALALILGAGVLVLGLYFLVSAFRSLQAAAPLPAGELEAAKYGEHRIDEAQLTDFAETVNAYMATARPHLDPALTLEALARPLPLTSRELSQTLNRHFGQSFYEFIARWRVADAKARLLERPGDTITQVMLDSGFSSKSSFTTAFRRETGLTPSQWRANRAGSNTRPRTPGA